MVTKWIEAAMRHAHYEIMENGRYWGEIPPCPGAWAEAATLEECREALRSALEDWLLFGFDLRQPLPVIDGIDLNPREPEEREKTKEAKEPAVADQPT